MVEELACGCSATFDVTVVKLPNVQFFNGGEENLAECFTRLIILGKNAIGELESTAEIRNGRAGEAVGDDGLLTGVHWHDKLCGR